MPDLTPRYQWTIPAPAELSAATVADAEARGLSPRLMRVLARRGQPDAHSLAARFDAPERSLHDPWLLPDAARVVERVARAVAAQERALVFGDFDADGLTGLAILTLTLRELGIDAAPYVPHRTDEGHGISLAAIGRAKAEGRTLLLTADCGSTSIAEIEAAHLADIDVIVTDHHTLPSVLPAAVAIVNPHRADSHYPDARLSGAGVAFKVAQLLLSGRPGGAAKALAMADLAAIGSVADVVPLEGENRAICRLGLALLANDPRPGLAALLASARVDPRRMDRDAIAFGLAPRINALGRVGDAAGVAELLLATDPAAIADLTARIEAANDLRRTLTTDALAEARTAVGPHPGEGMIIVAGDWPPGVIGLVAGKLAEEHGRPSVVFCTAVDPWRGSARSAGGFDLAAAFASCGQLFERFGGHPAAAGCHLPRERYEAFRVAMADRMMGFPAQPRRLTLALDLVARAESVDHVLFAALAPLERAGDEPALLGIAGLVVTRARVANGGHTQLTLRKGIDVLDAICFGRAELAEQLHEGDVVDVAARLSSRTFGGHESLQLEIKDVAPSGHLAGLRRAEELSQMNVGAAG